MLEMVLSQMKLFEHHNIKLRKSWPNDGDSTQLNSTMPVTRETGQEKTIERQKRMKNSLILINRQILIPLAQRLHHALPPLHRLRPRLPPPPLPIILSSRRDPQPALLVMIKHPQPHRPRRKHQVHETQFLTQEPRPFALRRHGARKLPQVTQELVSGAVNGRRALARLPLQEAVEARDDARGDEVHPDAALGLEVRVEGLQPGAVVRVGFLEVLADDVRFVQGLRVRGGRGADLEGGDEAAGVEAEERGGLVVRVHLDILVGDLLLLEGEPDALHCEDTKGSIWLAGSGP